LRAEGFFCNLDILYGGLGIGKLQFLKKKNLILFSAVIFFNFWSLKPWIRIGIQPKMLDPDPDEMNADPQPCWKNGILKVTDQEPDPDPYLENETLKTCKSTVEGIPYKSPSGMSKK
jgi:hypothetical protein